jgi:predicted N-acyltransferase
VTTTYSSLNIGVDRRVQDVSAEQWDKLIGPRGFYAATPWLRHAEATATTPPFYFTARSVRQHVANLVAYPLEAGTPYVFCRADRIVDRVHQQAAGGPAAWAPGVMPSLTCGGRNPSHTKAGISPELSGSEQRQALGAIATAATEQACAEGLHSIAFLYVDDDDSALRSVLGEQGFTALPADTAYSLAVPADGSFGSYLARFNQRRRVKIKRELRALEEAHVTYRTQPLTAELAERIAPLEMALYAKHGTPADEQAFMQVMHSIAANTSGTTRVTTAHIDGQLCGFVLFFTHRAQMYARQAGFDYELQGNAPVYFGLVYYELLRIALAERVTDIHYSTGSGLVKISRGCVPREQIAYVKALTPLVNHELRALGELTGGARQ